MAAKKPGLKLMVDLIHLQAHSPNLFDDIGILNGKTKGVAKGQTWAQFTNDYPELFNGNIRKFPIVKKPGAKQEPWESFLASTRRAYNQGKKSRNPVVKKDAKMIQEVYNGTYTRPTGGSGGGQKPPVNNLALLYTRNGEATYRIKSGGTVKVVSSVVNVDKKTKVDLKHIVYLNMFDVSTALTVHKQYRVLVEVKFKSGSYGWLSSKRLPIPSNRDMADLFDQLQSHIVNQDGYKYADIIEIIESYESVDIYWI